MARKKPHEEHVNHEAWAIPYGDLITLLLAFFVVMYAVSSVNEGKYRVMAEALAEAFGGPPRSMQPIQIGKIQKAGENEPNPIQQAQRHVTPAMGGGMRALNRVGLPTPPNAAAQQSREQQAEELTGKAAAQLKVISEEINKALVELIEQDLVVVRRTKLTLEIEIKADILYSSGSAQLTGNARNVIIQLAAILAPHDNPIRVEGHTDNVPIATLAFPSNWELSAARATSVVRLFSEHNIDPQRLSIQGHGEYKPLADNGTAEGRNRNRRVVIVVMPNQSDAALPPELAKVEDLPPASDSTTAKEPKS
ncbi:MAG: flagellar motor protein MotD [Salinisphaeraceae bacterium]|nr:flagellar motor protein MotD [Salinisphaeraceae bacterium]